MRNNAEVYLEICLIRTRVLLYEKNSFLLKDNSYERVINRFNEERMVFIYFVVILYVFYCDIIL